MSRQGDEVCKGTEELSATSIIASTIMKFSENNVSFIMATHLHKLYTLNYINSLSNVKYMHLDIQYDKNIDEIIYGRKLKEGISESVYGIEIAKYILNDNEFIKRATKVRNDITNTTQQLLVNKKTSYNSEVFMDECHICSDVGHPNDKDANNTQLDAHHIIFQKDFDVHNNKDHIKRNLKSNLVVLCKHHHDMVHNNTLVIDGYKDTIDGNIKLSYRFIE